MGSCRGGPPQEAAACGPADAAARSAAAGAVGVDVSVAVAVTVAVVSADVGGAEAAAAAAASSPGLCETHACCWEQGCWAVNAAPHWGSEP